MSIHRNVPIIPTPKRKRDQRVRNAQHGSSTEEAGVIRRSKSALAHGKKWFDYGGDTYVLRGGRFVPWWKV